MPRTLHATAQAIQQGSLSPVEMVETCLARIEQVEPRIHAWVLVDAEGARHQALQLHEELKRGHSRGPLHGIPVGIKDIFDVHDLPTACGSRLWKQSIARHDCTVVQRLRQAGAIILGKTVTTQYASFDPPPTRNPWNVQRTPGGSSSGSAAAVAAGMCLGALGSQTGGSITRPASYCGVAGCKPTYNRVSLQGTLPLAHSMDHPGPIAPCVLDLALLLQVIAGPDPLDPECALRPVPDYRALLAGASTPPRLGRVRGLFEERASSEMRQLLDRVCATLGQAGSLITEIALPAGFGEVLERHRAVMAVEALSYHEQRLRLHPEDYDPNFTTLLREGQACSAAEYARCKEHQRQLRASMRGCFEGVDALIMPATTSAAPDARTTGDPAFNSPWSYTGLPVVSFRAGWTADQMPLAVQLVAPAWHEGELFQAAAWCERTLQVESREVPSA